jgi:hypothetical protein
MHAVSPVHVYVENQVKTPMTGTNIDVLFILKLESHSYK